MIGLIGRKIGMAQIFSDKGMMIPVTVIEAGPCPVVQVKTADSDGYDSVQLGFEEVTDKHINKPKAGHLKKHGSEAKPRILREFRVRGAGGGEGDASALPGAGEVLTVESIEAGSHVDVTGTTKGRGFAGVVRRHNFGGGPASHGSKTGDLPGSIGNSAYPGRVWKGKKLPGHMGDVNVTIQNLEVVQVKPEENLVLIKGAIPGGPQSLVTIRPAVKKAAKKGK